MRRGRSPTCGRILVIAALVLSATLVLRLDRVVRHRDRHSGRAWSSSLELVNTAVEAIVDLAHRRASSAGEDGERRRGRRRLIAAVAAVVVGYLIFYQGSSAAGQRVFEAVSQVPANVALIVLAVVAIATIFAKAWVGRGSALQGGAVSGHAALAFAAATMLAFFYQKPLGGVLAYLRGLSGRPEPRRSANPHAFEVCGGPSSGPWWPWPSTSWSAPTLCYNGADLRTLERPISEVRAAALVSDPDIRLDRWVDRSCCWPRFFAASEAALISDLPACAPGRWPNGGVEGPRPS